MGAQGGSKWTWQCAGCSCTARNFCAKCDAWTTIPRGQGSKESWNNSNAWNRRNPSVSTNASWDRRGAGWHDTNKPTRGARGTACTSQATTGGQKQIGALKSDTLAHLAHIPQEELEYLRQLGEPAP